MKCSTKPLHTASIFLVLSIATIHFGIMQTDYENLGLFYNLSMIASLVIVVAIASVIYRRYIGAKKFRTPYLFLLLAYISYLLGELGWFAYENIFLEYPYPSLADLGFFFDFVFTIIFLIATIRCFSTLTRYDMGAASLVMSVITAIYLVLSIEAETETFDLLFGLIFIISSSAVFSYSIIAMNKLKNTTIGTAWMIIFMAFLVSTTADAFYYTTENIGKYSYSHIMNTLWIVSNALLVYALILHRRVL